MDSFQEERLLHEALASEYERQRPSILWRPALSLDGNQYCALYGANLQEGCAGFGDSPDAAMRDFDKNWTTKLTARSSTGGRR